MPSRAEREEEAPDPIEHAAPDVELAEAQLTVGRSDLAREPEEAAELEEELEYEAEQAAGGEPTSGGEVATRSPVEAEHRAVPGNRLINFIQGSWRELQRVQWPDRRQVMQATGVVIGFVIIAGAFLGVADFLAGKVMNFVLTGHFK